jgi:hypothetical protein
VGAADLRGDPEIDVEGIGSTGIRLPERCHPLP